MIAAPHTARATVTLGSWIQHSPDDIAGFTSFTGNDVVQNVTIPFTVTIEGVGYTTVAISSNGWLEFGGNTQGTSQPANVCLPTGTHTNPFLAAYWDDLNPFGNNIRYGTVGTSPNRTFIADFEVDLTSGSEGADDLRFQVQIHETSNQINIRYRDQQSATNGIDATIGFQGAGGAGANTVLPLTCNGKVLDDNRSDEGWSIDAGRANNVTMAAFMASSPDDITGFTTLSGDNAIAGVTLPAGFSVTIEGTSYTTLTIGTNGTIQFGTTSGGNPSANTALPNAGFPNPTIFYFWDDLQTEGTNIRYGTIGTSPNRTFIVDFQENLLASSGDKVNGQVQIHERSNLINVKYRGTLSPNANGQTATIGFQGAGGASAAAYPLTFNGKILDDDRPDEGWSIHPRAASLSGPPGNLGSASLHAFMEHSPNDIGGFATLSGDNAIAGVTLPAGFSVTVDGTSYTTLTIGTNGIIQLGTTTGANPGPNTALPSASFPNPTIFYFWDDLQTEGGNIRYGTVGTSPNRTFIVDFQENLVASSGDKVNGQVEIHEGSNVFNIQYRSTLSANANGQTATIGFQGAGGASAAAYPLTFNGKILDDNLPNAGWSIAPLPLCGNGIVETKEECDTGAANGTAASCCSSSCSFNANATPCTDDGNDCTNDQCNGSSASCLHPSKTIGSACGSSSDTPCDNPDTCNGSGTCLANNEPVTTECRASGGECDLAENCNGAGACPADAKRPNLFPCTGDGIDCTSDQCDGTNDACQHPNKPLGAACGSASDTVCDNPDTCNGSGNCLINNEPNTTLCRGSGGICDVAENCDGAGSCPMDAKSSAQCRASAGVCDLAESCDGVNNDCPADAKSSAQCRASVGVCDLADSCDGVNNDCPSDAKSSAQCRASAGACDLADSCDGVSDDCPADAKSSAVCRAASGDCDLAESCDGVGDSCPTDAFKMNGAACGSPSDTDCDDPDTCDGNNTCLVNNAPLNTACGDASDTECSDPDTCNASGSCLANDEASGTPCTADSETCTVDECNGGGLCAHPAGNSGTECRTSSGVCDTAETCDGTNPTCPVDSLAPPTTICRGVAMGEFCDAAEFCTGLSASCPPDGVQPNTTVCRAAAGACDLADTCDGSSKFCPADAKSTAVCRGAADVCDVAESCDGITDDCPADAFEPATTVCRTASAGQLCDAVEYCSGAGPSCPADAVEPNGTPCRAAAGVCDLGEQCDGTSSACPADAKSAALCRAAAGICDAAENCDGSNNDCPADAKSSAVCRSAAGICDVADSCDGINDDCPADGFAPATTVCRAASGGEICDAVEHCTGGGPSCPPDMVAPNTTVCRPAAGVCDLAEACDGLTTVCPADAKSTALCRAAVGVCDVAESCNGSGNACPADAFASDNTPCPDGTFCNGDETCQSGVCSPGSAPCPVLCDESADMCLTSSCATAPQTTCRTAEKSLLLIKNKLDDNKDKLIWKWIKGTATSQTEFGDPTSATNYALCIYAGSGENLVASVEVPASAAKWSALGTKGYKYFDEAHVEDGAQKIKLKGSDQNKSKALLKGRGVQLPDPLDAMALDLPVKVQLVNQSNGICFQGVYAAAKKSTNVQFKAKSP